MKKSNHTAHILYLLIVGIVFSVFVIVFIFFPRSTFSELEKRDLAQIPPYTTDSLFSGQFAQSLTHWFSDSEPYRDVFMTWSMQFTKAQRLHIRNSEEAISFHAASQEEQMPEEWTDAGVEYEDNESDSTNNSSITQNSAAKIAHSGIIISGEEPNARALMSFGGTPTMVNSYAKVINEYHEAFPDIFIWVMPIPNAVDYYCPEKAAGCTKKSAPCANALFDALDEQVHIVNIYDVLKVHVNENIFLRTDHHWAPLGGYYAAEQFCRQAGLPFMVLEDGYEEKVVHKFVGSMYGYSRDISVKNSPEDFVYYIPTKTEYETFYHRYTIDESYKVTGESRGFQSGKYFYQFRDGSGGAYCTFMGGDTKITNVKTAVKNGRRVMILKDSFGNTIPGYLFYSFEEIFVVDYRYFTKNMRQFVADSKITDILFANNIFVVCGYTAAANYHKYLTQKDIKFSPVEQSITNKDFTTDSIHPISIMEIGNQKDSIDQHSTILKDTTNSSTTATTESLGAND